MSDVADELVNREDREHVASVTDESERAVIVASLLRHRALERLAAGDPMPVVEVTRLQPPGEVSLDELPAGRPVVLVFGSYT